LLALNVNNLKATLLKVAKRRAKFKAESLEAALEHFKDYEKKSLLPFVNMTSLSMERDISLNRILNYL
jgi:hypothetical protein